MTEVAEQANISLADVYASCLLQSLQRPALGATRRQVNDDPSEVERQCIEVDELWVELGLCIHRWRGYDPRFIATRFCNMHYAKQPFVGNAWPPEDVWQYVVRKIEDQVYGKLVVMRHREYTPGRIYAWKQ